MHKPTVVTLSGGERGPRGLKLLKSRFHHQVDQLVCPGGEAAFRGRYLGEFERRLQTEFTPDGAAAKVTYLEFVYRQARSVADVVRRRGTLYAPLRAHA